MNTSSGNEKVIRSVGRPPESIDSKAIEYLRKKLEEIRKDCQWLIGLGAASVFGVIIKQEINIGTNLHKITLIIITCQMLVALLGAMSFWQGNVSKAQLIKRLEFTLRVRYWLRNGALVLLVAAFLLLAYQIW